MNFHIQKLSAHHVGHIYILARILLLFSLNFSTHIHTKYLTFEEENTSSHGVDDLEEQTQNCFGAQLMQDQDHQKLHY
jgi:hypothetical protein